MRIAVATSEYHRGGGFERYATQLATALHSRGHEVTVYARRADPSKEDEGISIVRYRTLDWSMLTTMASQPYVLTRLLRKAAEQFDAVICVGMACLAPVVLMGPGTHRAYYLATISSRGGGLIRRIVERVRPFHWTIMLWERAMLQGGYPRLVVVPGERGVRDYVENFAFPHDRISVVPLGVERSEFRFSADLRERVRAELGLAAETKLIVNVANRSRQKGLDVMVDALERLETDEPWHCAFAGSGSAMPSLRRRAARLLRRGRVSLLGRVPSTCALYCAADVLLFPSRFDPWGFVVTEALACGLPVIVSAGIGSATAVVEGRNGWLISDPADSSEIAEKLARFLPVARSLDREEVAGSVAWLDHRVLAQRLEQELVRLVP